jgi:hypothetical protein
MMSLFCSGASLNGITEEQFYLAKLAGISMIDSNNIPDFERVMLVGMLMRDLKKEREANAKAHKG